MIQLVRKARDAMHLVVREVAKSGVVGAVAFVIDTGLYNLLRLAGESTLLGDRPVGAKIISVGVAMTVAWLGNRYWTFRHRRRTEIRREMVLFVVINLIGMGIAAGCIGFSHYVLGFESLLADNIAGNGVGLFLGMIFRFLCYRYVVFRGDLEERRRTRPTRPTPAPQPVPAAAPATVVIPPVTEPARARAAVSPTIAD